MASDKNYIEVADIKPEEVYDLSSKIIGFAFMIDSLLESFENHGIPDGIHEIREVVSANTSILIEQIDSFVGRDTILI